MSLYSQMQSIAGPSSSCSSVEPVQRELHSLLRQLHWSYAALWTFNHRTSRLEWRGGYFRVNPTATDTEVWNEHLFNSSYNSCTFGSGQGSVGMAYTETRNIWVNGSSVHQSAGSKEQAQFLHQAGIETVVCIPWAESVLELGTSKMVAENLDLTEMFCFCLSDRILPSLAMTQSGPFPPLTPTRHLLDQDFELNSLNDQMRRSSSLSSLNTDIFLQSEEQSQTAGRDLDSSIARTTVDPRWRPATQPPSILPPPNLQAMRVQHSNTTGSSSVSISEDGSVRQISPAHSPENHHNNVSVISDATGITVTDEIQQAISQMLEEGDHTHWRNMYMNQQPEAAEPRVNVLPSTNQRGPAFELWRHPRVRAAPATANRPNQALLRRCIQMLQLILTAQQASSNQPPAPDVQSLPDPRMTSSSASPEVEFPDIGFADDSHPFDQTAPLREQRRPRGPKAGTTGAVNPSHDEAALTHMMNERKRRIKQKECFSALRKLVPIISKADKASTLGDAILYIKDLQESITNLEASRAQTEARYENLKRTSEELEQRNKELEAMCQARSSAGATSSSHRPPRPQSSSRSF